MANKPRFRLDYFFWSVTPGDDNRIRHLKRKYGSSGLHAYIHLLELIYRNGSYLKIDLPDLVEELALELNVEEEAAKTILLGLVELRLFDKDLFLKGFLTSVDIQEHYYFATKERKTRVQPECWLLSQKQMDEIDDGIKYTKIYQSRHNANLGGDNHN